MIVSFDISESLIKKMDEITDREGFSNRSEIIRTAIRNYIYEYNKIESKNGYIEGIINLFYHHELIPNLAKIKFKYTSILKSLIQSHFEHSNVCCVDILIVSGEEEHIRTLIRELNSIKGIDVVKFIRCP